YFPRLAAFNGNFEACASRSHHSPYDPVPGFVEALEWSREPFRTRQDRVGRQSDVGQFDLALERRPHGELVIDRGRLEPWRSLWNEESADDPLLVLCPN